MPATAASENPYLLTLPQLISAKKKIGQVAAFFDPVKHSLKGFEAQALNPTEFREQLRRNFLIKLSDDELGAIIVLFDKDGDGEVDSTEFVNEFFRLGKMEKTKFFNTQQDNKLKVDTRKEKQRIDHEKIFIERNKSHFPEEWSKKEELSAIRKVAKVAFSYKPNSWLGGGPLRAFYDCGSLNAVQFREQLKQNFEIKLSPGEVSALMNIFDNDKNGVVDCAEFLYRFFRFRRNESDRHFARQTRLTKEKNDAEIKRREAETIKYEQFALAKILPCTDDDRSNATAKITHAASVHQGPILNAVKAFESKDMTPEAFREQLKRQFFIRLSPGELDAMVKIFDANGDGEISSVEFLTTFFRIGSVEKRKKLLKHRRIKNLKKQKEEERLLLRTTKFKDAVKTQVKWPSLPDDEAEDDTLILQQDTMRLFSPIKGSKPGTTNSSRPTTAPMTASPGKTRAKRKPTLSESLSSSTSGFEFHATDGVSITNFFPKASQETKNFIVEIEEAEQKILNSDIFNDTNRTKQITNDSNIGGITMMTEEGSNEDNYEDDFFLNN